MDTPEALMTAYVDAWRRHDVSPLDAMHVAPTTTLRADGSLHVLPDTAAILAFYAGALRGFEAEGTVGCDLVDVETRTVGARAALVEGTWIIRHADGSEIRRWRQTYSLVRRAEGWRIFGSIVHAPA